MNSAKRLGINTLAQYLRTGANVCLSLVATRLVLEGLGTVDYGIYSLVGGVVSMLSFFTNSLTSTTQRYLSFYAEQNNLLTLKEYFFNSIIIHISIGIALSIIMLSMLPILFSGFLNIPENSIAQAKSVYIFLIVMLFVAMMASPFRAVLISHENIVYISFIDVLDGVLKLAIAYIIIYFQSERLLWYAILMVSVTSFNLLAFSIFCFWKYPESRSFKIKLINRTKLKELTSFAGWTIYGTLCLFGRVQGISVVLNKFIGTAVNAAYGISLSVNAALNSVSSSLQTALAPQLIKAEGRSERNKMLMLTEFGCKASFVLLSIIAIPIVFNIDLILNLWLKSVPQYANFFCVILILSNLFDQLTVGFNVCINAVGKLKAYMLTVNTLKLLTTCVVGLLLYIGCSLECAFCSYIVIEIIGGCLRIVICQRYVNLNINQYIRNVILRSLLPTALLSLLYWFFIPYEFSTSDLVLLIALGSVFYLIMVFYIGLQKNERIILINYSKAAIDKILLSQKK